MLQVYNIEFMLYEFARSVSEKKRTAGIVRSFCRLQSTQWTWI